MLEVTAIVDARIGVGTAATSAGLYKADSRRKEKADVKESGCTWAVSSN